jgi:hypothetical protein
VDASPSRADPAIAVDDANLVSVEVGEFVVLCDPHREAARAVTSLPENRGCADASFPSSLGTGFCLPVSFFESEVSTGVPGVETLVSTKSVGWAVGI